MQVRALYQGRADSENRTSRSLLYDFAISGFVSQKFWATEQRSPRVLGLQSDGALSAALLGNRFKNSTLSICGPNALAIELVLERAVRRAFYD